MKKNNNQKTGENGSRRKLKLFSVEGFVNTTVSQEEIIQAGKANQCHRC